MTKKARDLRHQRIVLTEGLLSMEPPVGPVWEAHVLHSYPVANVNRDRFQRPKEVTFGGVRRARVSSQSQKRAARQLMRKGLSVEPTGVRTRNLASLLAEQLAVKELWGSEIANAVARAVVEAAGFAGEEADAVALFSEGEIGHLAETVASHFDEVETSGSKPKLSGDLAKRLKEGVVPAALQPVEAAISGRFFASRPDLTVEAAVQVAHSVGVHPMFSEVDFFSAVEEAPRKEAMHAGAAFTGDADFNASMHYRYARVDVVQLALNLAGEGGQATEQLDRARRLGAMWLDAFIDAVPAGKQTTMNAQTPPAFTLLVERCSGGWNLVNAYLEPVWKHGDTLGEAIRKMDAHLKAVLESQGDADLLSLRTDSSLPLELEELAPVAIGWTPGSYTGRRTSLLEHLGSPE